MSQIPDSIAREFARCEQSGVLDIYDTTGPLSQVNNGHVREGTADTYDFGYQPSTSSVSMPTVDVSMASSTDGSVLSTDGEALNLMNKYAQISSTLKQNDLSMDHSRVEATPTRPSQAPAPSSSPFREDVLFSGRATRISASRTPSSRFGQLDSVNSLDYVY